MWADRREVSRFDRIKVWLLRNARTLTFLVTGVSLWMQIFCAPTQSHSYLLNSCLQTCGCFPFPTELPLPFLLLYLTTEKIVIYNLVFLSLWLVRQSHGPQFDHGPPRCNSALYETSFTDTFFWLVQTYLSILSRWHSHKAPELHANIVKDTNSTARWQYK